MSAADTIALDDVEIYTRLVRYEISADSAPLARELRRLCDQSLKVEAKLLASEGIMSPVRFLYMTPHHSALTPFRIAETYTGSSGQGRIKLCDDQGRVWHYDVERVVYAGVCRDGGT